MSIYGSLGWNYCYFHRFDRVRATVPLSVESQEGEFSYQVKLSGREPFIVSCLQEQLRNLCKIDFGLRLSFGSINEFQPNWLKLYM